ncbi:MAG: DNA-binding protein [Oligoflexia bacterium]|nr:DNA-binding protein [Oligoflexia bacterium]
MDSKFQSIKQFANQNQAFSEPSLRWLIFNCETNGLSNAVVRIGRKILIDTEAFGQWIESHRQPQKKGA